LVAFTLVAAACGGDDDDNTADTTAAAETTAAAATTAASSDTTEAAAETPAASEEPSGGTLTYAAEQASTSYNHNASDQGLFANSLVLNPIQPQAFIADDKGGVFMDEDILVSAEVVSDDPQTIEYVIQEDAAWEDGDPVDCDDFYLAWLAQNGKVQKADGTPLFNPGSTVGYEQISEVQCAEGDKTVRTVYETPFADWKALFLMYPAHVVERESGVESIVEATADEATLAPAAEFWNAGWVADSGIDKETMLSAGPYTLESFTPGESLVLVRNEAYWAKPAEADTIVFKQVPDATAQPQALANSEVNVITPQPNEDLIAQVEGIDGVEYSVEGGFTFQHLDLNLANPVLADLAVRQAFALCMNRQEIVDTLVKPLKEDAEVIGNRIYFPFQEAYQDNAGDFAEQDIATAKSTLEAAGWALGSDGVYAKDGQRLAFRIGRRDPNPSRQKIIELVTAQCKEAGFEITEQADPNFNAELLPASQYDVALFAWVGTPFNSSNKSIYETGGGQNWNNYSNPEVDSLFEQANASLDEAERVELYNQIDQILWDDMITIPLYQFPDLVATKGVEGVKYNPSSAGITWNVEEWKLTDQ
jgi:peptide/nickel transport system substrate-binding protein